MTSWHALKHPTFASTPPTTLLPTAGRGFRFVGRRDARTPVACTVHDARHVKWPGHHGRLCMGPSPSRGLRQFVLGAASAACVSEDCTITPPTLPVLSYIHSIHLIVVFLFLAVWVPCCTIAIIVFPLIAPPSPGIPFETHDP